MVSESDQIQEKAESEPNVELLCHIFSICDSDRIFNGSIWLTPRIAVHAAIWILEGIDSEEWAHDQID